MSNNTDENKKPSKVEVLQKFIKMSRDTAVSQLNSDELSILNNILNDGNNASDGVKELPEDSPLKQAWYNLRLDRLKLIQSIESLKEVESGGNGMFAMIQQSVGQVGNSVGNAVGIQQASSNPNKPEFEGNPLDLIALVDDWMSKWKIVSDDFAMHLLKKAVAKRAKPAIIVLMDKGIITSSLELEIEYRVPGKKYKIGEYDKQKSRPIDVMLKSSSESVMDAIVEHPIGASLISNAKDESVYSAFEYLFDTYKTDTLVGLMDKGLNPNIKEPSTGRPIICNLAYKAEDKDLPVLDAMSKHGLNVRVSDEMSVTPLMQGVKQGRIEFVKFLLEQSNIDLYAVSSFQDTVLTLVAEGPNRFEERYREYEARVQVSEEHYQEKLSEWKLKVAEAKAAGEKEPQEPQKPQVREPVKEYPMELISLIQDAWNAGNPTLNVDNSLELLRTSDPERILAEEIINGSENFDFGLNF